MQGKKSEIDERWERAQMRSVYAKEIRRRDGGGPLRLHRSGRLCHDRRPCVRHRRCSSCGSGSCTPSSSSWPSSSTSSCDAPSARQATRCSPCRSSPTGRSHCGSQSWPPVSYPKRAPSRRCRTASRCLRSPADRRLNKSVETKTVPFSHC